MDANREREILMAASKTNWALVQSGKIIFYNCYMEAWNRFRKEHNIKSWDVDKLDAEDGVLIYIKILEA